MNKVKQIKSEIERQKNGLIDTNGNFYSREDEGAYHALCVLESSLPEEPSKVWHDVSERPVYNKDSKNCNQIVVYGGDEWEYSLSVCSMINENTIFAPISEREYEWGKCPFTKWAYADDLLDIQEEPEKQSVSDAMAEIEEKSKAFTEAHKGENADDILAQMRGEEPVSEDLEKASMKWLRPKLDNSPYTFYKDEKLIMELTHFSGYDMLDAIEFGAQWKERQFEKNRLAACDRQTKEEAEREQDFMDGIIKNEHRTPTYSDAIEYGMRLKEQMMEKAVKWIEKNFNMPNDFEQHFRKAMSDN